MAKKYQRKWVPSIDPNNMSKGQAEAAMLDGMTVQHSSWSVDESLIYDKSLNQIMDEDSENLGDFDGKYWTDKHLNQWGWKVVNR